MKQIQLINEDQEYQKQFTNKVISSWGLDKIKDNYEIISVIGPQSSGKSTLLNGMFSTCFDVMDEQQRQKTTKGIWLGRAEKEPILILDVEGTDGRERGEDLQFERRSALFSIAVSQVILINIWETSIGLHAGANMMLLKTVLEVNYQLFSKNQSKTRLTFVIRDYMGKTPLASHEKTLREDLVQIWEEIKTKQNGNEMFNDLFRFEVVAIPNKIIQEEEFDNAVKEFANKIYDDYRSNIDVKTADNGKNKLVPTDALPQYFESIWETIMENKDLDIPSQQILLSKFRSEEIVQEIMEEAIRKIAIAEKQIEETKLGFQEASNEIISDAMILYDSKTTKYDSAVIKEKRVELEKRLYDELYRLYEMQVRKIRNDVEQIFVKELNRLKHIDGCMFAEETQTTMKKSLECFKDLCQKLIIEGSSWSWEPFYKDIAEIMTTMVEKESQYMIQAKLNGIRDTFREQLSRTIPNIMNCSEMDIWEQINMKSMKCTEEMEKQMDLMRQQFDINDVAIRHMNEALTQWCQMTLKDVINGCISSKSITMRIRERFTKKFRYDENGLPRVWSSPEHIEKIYSASLVDARQFLTVLGHCVGNLDYQTITEEDQGKIYDYFIKDAEMIYIEAKRAQMSITKHIPTWVIILIVILGWNEIIAVIRSPLYLTLICFGLIIYSTLSVLQLMPMVKNILSEYKMDFMEMITANPYSLGRPSTPVTN